MSASDPHEDDVIGKAYDARLARRLFRYARPYRGLVVASVSLLITDGALQLVGPLLTRRVIDVAIPRGDSDMVVASVVLFAAALAGQFALAYGETILTARIGQRIMHDLRTELFAHLQRLPIAYFDRTPVGRLVTRVTSDVEALNELFTSGVVAGLGDIFTLTAISILMLIADWRLALAAFAVIPLIVLASNVFRLQVRETYRDIRARIARINAYLHERLSGIRVVQLFGEEPRERVRFDALNRAHLSSQLRSITVYALYFPVIEILTTVAIASLVVVGAHRVGAGSLTVGTVAAFLQLVRRFFDPLQDLSDKYNTLQQAMAASERIFGVLDEKGGEDGAAARPSEDRDAGSVDGAERDPSAGGGNERTARGDGGRAVPIAARLTSVSFENVWFAYDLAHLEAGAATPSEPEWVLRGVSFSASPGETVAIVGHTGAGKTTIVNLLLRFYDPQRGRILLNGVDIRSMPVDELRARVGYVQQDIFLFAGDIASNIRLSTPMSDDAVRGAAARVGADRVIQRLPGAYAYELGERGSSISVGERQLLSFARAIAADPSLLVLDEATSAVDSEIEAEIQGAVEVLMSGRTTIAIAHRLSTIVRATQILVIHRGEVRERGTHRQLLAAGGLYARLYQLQIAGEIRTPERAG